MEGRVRALRLVFVGHEWLLNPLDVVRLELLGELRSVLHIQRHVAVEHEWEVRPALLPPLLDELNILAHPSIAMLWAVGERELSAVEAELLGEIGPRRGGVARHLATSAQSARPSLCVAVERGRDKG